MDQADDQHVAQLRAPDRALIGSLVMLEAAAVRPKPRYRYVPSFAPLYPFPAGWWLLDAMRWPETPYFLPVD